MRSGQVALPSDFRTPLRPARFAGRLPWCLVHGVCVYIYIYIYIYTCVYRGRSKGMLFEARIVEASLDDCWLLVADKWGQH